MSDKIEYNRAYYQKHKGKMRAKQRAWYQGNKEQRKLYDQSYYQANKGQKSLLNREGNKRVKVEVLTYYGGGRLSCTVCGEDRLACLSIDHLDGKGAAHRRELKTVKTGHPFYRWLKTQGHPTGYQTLCMNCQFVKRDLNGEISNA